MSNWNNSADTYKCPGCAGNLFYKPESNVLHCDFCGSDYDPKLFDMLKVFEKISNQPDAADDDQRQEIVCSSCGAVVITDENTSASICCFCGSPALAGRRLTKEFRPDYILPFQVKKEEAKALFLKWAKTNKYIPNDFTSEENINKLTGLYVPFWLIDCMCDAEYYGSGTINQGNNRAYFSLERQVQFYLARVPFDGSRRISDRLMRAIEPFDYSEMKEYKDSYLPGYFAERYDQSPLELSQCVMDRLRSYGEEAVKTISCKKYDTVTLTNGGSEAKDLKYSYALLPVWFMNYQYNGINYGFAVNGQTGEVCGDLPYDPLKRNIALSKVVLLRLVLPLLLLAIATVASIYFGIAFTPRALRSDTLSIIVSSLPYVWGGLGLAWIAAFVRKWRKIAEISQNPIDPPPPVEQYFDTTKRPTVKEEDKFISIMPRIKDEDENPFFKRIFRGL